MSVEFLMKTGLEANRAGYTPKLGELIVTTDTNKLYAGDGSTPGGVALSSSCSIVADEAAMLALKARPGDLAFRIDKQHMFVLNAEDATLAASWVDTDLNSKADVGLDLVQNYGISDAIDEDISTQYASSKAVKTAYDRAVTAETDSRAYTDQVKSDLLGGAPDAALDTLLELGNALNANGDAIAAITTELATKLATSTFDAFVARTDNPHAVTKAQVGLGNVENYTISDAVDEDVSTQYASSKAVKAAYDLAAIARNESLDSQKLEGYTLAEVLAQARNGLSTSTDLQAHLDDVDNPHGVTKAQVGLGNVENASIASILASDAETMASSDNSKRVATTEHVKNVLADGLYLKDGDTLHGGTF